MPKQDDEMLRDEMLFEIRTWEFTCAMESHQIPHTQELAGEYVYYATEMMVMWQDGMYDAEHGFLLN
jgi:hypothetical protein